MKRCVVRNTRRVYCVKCNSRTYVTAFFFGILLSKIAISSEQHFKISILRWLLCIVAHVFMSCIFFYKCSFASLKIGRLHKSPCSVFTFNITNVFFMHNGTLKVSLQLQLKHFTVQLIM